MKTAKGTLDYDPEMMQRIQTITEIIRHNATNLGAEEIETPSMELTNLLLDKYGDEAEGKLIYRLEKIGHEDLSLRYDLTVPFQRYIAAHGLENMKRFQVGKVYRKDQPNPSRGRYREFIQADFDIVGSYEKMIPEAQVMKLIVLSLKQMGLEKYVIRYNFRDNLFSMVQMAGIDAKMFKEVCISIDKLDKKSWNYVADELRGKEITEESLVVLKELLDHNYQSDEISDDLNLFLQYGKVFDYHDQIQFDASLARGLDYYTGLIYEVVLDRDVDSTEEDNNPTLVAGGRYDRLIKFKHKRFLPAIGVSFGVNRLELVLREILKRPLPFKIYVVSQPDFLLEKMRIVNHLLEMGYQVDFYDGKRRNDKQINNAIRDNYQYILIYGEDGDQIKVKSNDHKADQICSLDHLVEMIQQDPFQSD